jgi:hypothetical protein
MELEGSIIYAFITFFAFGLLLVSYFTYKKYKNSKLFFVSLVFFILLVKGFILSYSLFNETITDFLSNPYFAMFDLMILVLLFLATLKR